MANQIKGGAAGDGGESIVRQGRSHTHPHRVGRRLSGRHGRRGSGLHGRRCRRAARLLALGAPFRGLGRNNCDLVGKRGWKYCEDDRAMQPATHIIETYRGRGCQGAHWIVARQLVYRDSNGGAGRGSPAGVHPQGDRQLRLLFGRELRQGPAERRDAVLRERGGRNGVAHRLG